MRTLGGQRGLFLVVAALAVVAAAVRLASSQVDGRRAGERSGVTASSARRTGVGRVDPLERAGEADRTLVRQFPGRAARPSTLLSKPEGVDLDVLYIQMTPLYHAYCLDYSIDGLPRLCSGTENDKRWPDRGEIVTFTAHFMNKGTIASGQFDYAWAIDGVEVARGSFPNLLPGTGSAAAYSWPWDHDVVNGRLLGQHTVRFTLDPDDKVGETTRSNNTLENRTDATPLGFQITPEVYQALETPVDAKWPFSAEDWVQKQFQAMNEAFARSVFPSAPNGCEERVRLDQFRVTSNHVPNDGGIGGWFLSTDDRFNGSVDPDTDIDLAMIHELAHQLGVIDLYHFDYAVNQPHRVRDLSGRPVLLEHSSAYLPGLMSAEGLNPPQFDEHTTGGMNANKGYRRGYFGEYQYDLPAQTHIRVLDSTGAPAAGTTVRLFRVRRWAGDPLAEYAAPGIEVVTGLDGTAALPNRPASGPLSTATGHTLHDNPFGPVDVADKNMFLVEIRNGAHQEFTWLANTDLNLLAWRGGEVYEFASHVPPVGAPYPPAYLNGMDDGDVVSLRWGTSPSPGVVGYRVYRTLGPRDTWTKLADRILDTDFRTELDRTVIGYVVTAVDGAGRESGFSETYWGIHLDAPTGITVGAGNQRYVRLYEAILLQDGTGRSLDWSPVGGYDYGHLALDALGHLVMVRQRADTVAIVDPAAEESRNILREFGGTGSGPGQFHGPTGVAVSGDPCSWGGPYARDAHTLLLCHFDGTLDDAGGSRASATSVAFAAGRFGQGAHIDGSATLSYSTPPLLSPSQGAIELWLQPSWDGNDGKGHVFLQAGSQWANGVILMKDGADNLRFLAWANGAERGVGYHIGQWKSGEWHQLAVTWLGTALTMYVDGEVVAQTEDCQLPAHFGSRIFVGCATDGTQQADAVLDELRISDNARFGNSDTCTYRIVVADSGNNRLQVFDAAGNVVTSYGRTGVGPGEFAGPRGLALDGQGRVVVVDSGNSRLQLFAFDGTTFTFLREIVADLLDADGVAIRGNRIVVADTGHNQVKVFSDTGALVATYDGPNDGEHTGSFLEPHGVAIDNNGWIVVTDSRNMRVAVVIHREPAVRRRVHRGN